MSESADDFTAMYLAHADRVYAYLCAQIGPQDADELTAQVFLEAWRQRGTVRIDHGWMPWLIGVARNLARQSAKQHARDEDRAARLSHRVLAALSWPPAGHGRRRHRRSRWG